MKTNPFAVSINHKHALASSPFIPAAPTHLLFLLFLPPVVVERVGIGQVVHGDGQEHVKEDVVATDEEDDEVKAGQDPQTLHPAKGLDTVVHDHVPVLACQDLKDV